MRRRNPTYRGFHGSPLVLDAFTAPPFGPGGAVYGPGTYFCTDRKTAEDYAAPYVQARGNVYEVEITLDRPIRAKDDGWGNYWNDPHADYEYWDAEAGAWRDLPPRHRYLIEKHFDDTRKGGVRLKTAKERERDRQAFLAEGYDGCVIEPARMYVAFDPAKAVRVIDRKGVARRWAGNVEPESVHHSEVVADPSEDPRENPYLRRADIPVSLRQKMGARVRVHDANDYFPYLYHHTDEENLERIAREGLKPGDGKNWESEKVKEFSRGRIFFSLQADRWAHDFPTKAGTRRVTLAVPTEAVKAYYDGVDWVLNAPGEYYADGPHSGPLSDAVVKETIPPELILVKDDLLYHDLVSLDRYMHDKPYRDELREQMSESRARGERRRR